MQVTWVRSLDREDPLEEGMATHSSILAWRIPWTEEPGGLQSMGSQRVGHDWAIEHAPKPDKLKSELNPPKEGQWPSINSQFTHPETLKFRGNQVPLMKRCYLTAKEKKKIECKSSSLLDFKCPVALLSGWKPWGRKNNQILRIYGHWVKISVVHQKEQGASRSDKPQGLVSSPSHSSSPISVIFFLVLEWIIRNNV